jgi:transposase InsO family protein
LIHCNVTAHLTAAWTLQQLREAAGYNDRYRCLVHDRDSIFANHLDESIRWLWIMVLKSPPHNPKTNAICERMIGTIRRECLDWLIPLSETHLRFTLKSWIGHYNGGRPHIALLFSAFLGLYGSSLPASARDAAITPRRLGWKQRFLGL